MRGLPIKPPERYTPDPNVVFEDDYADDDSDISDSSSVSSIVTGILLRGVEYRCPDRGLGGGDLTR